MRYSIIIHASPSYQASRSAYRFAEALLASGHSLHRVFFYQDAVYQGSALCCPTQDERNPLQQWQALAQKYTLELVLCIAAAIKRGILDKDEAERYEKPAANLAAPFRLAGLGELVDAVTHSERLITFG